MCTKTMNQCLGNSCAPLKATVWFTAPSNVKRVSSSAKPHTDYVYLTQELISWELRKSNPCPVTTTFPCTRKCLTKVKDNWANCGQQTSSMDLTPITLQVMHLRSQPILNSCGRRWAGWSTRMTRRWKDRKVSRCSCLSARVKSVCSLNPTQRVSRSVRGSRRVTPSACSCCATKHRTKMNAAVLKCLILTGGCRKPALRISNWPCKMTLNKMLLCSLER